MNNNAGVNRALVVGAGFSGMTAALELNRAGIQVDLVERTPDWSTYGAGISLHGATLRVFRQIGILDRFLAEGAASDGVDILADADDSLIVQLPTPPVDDSGLPGGGAVMRPVLAQILAEAVAATTIRVRLGCSFSSIRAQADRVDVDFDDGSSGQYDLVIGADGLHSAVRRQAFPDAPAIRYAGQGVWRAVLETPDEIERVTMWMSGLLKVGINPVSDSHAYLFLTENRPDHSHVPKTEFVSTLTKLLQQFQSPLVGRIRDRLGEDNSILFRPLDQFLLPRPWHRGRVVLIGDALHATTPHLAAGACIGMEDAVVLADEITQAGSLPAALAAFEERRWDRCRMVVENSGRLGEIEMTGGDRHEHAELMRSSMAQLAQPV